MKNHLQHSGIVFSTEFVENYFYCSVAELMESTVSTNSVEFSFPQTKWNLSLIDEFTLNGNDKRVIFQFPE